MMSREFNNSNLNAFHNGNQSRFVDFDSGLTNQSSLMPGFGPDFGISPFGPGLNLTTSIDGNIAGSCTSSDQPAGWFAFVWLHFIVMFLLPVLVMTTCYGLIVYKFYIRTSKDSNPGCMHMSSCMTKDRRNVTRLCVVLVAAFVLCWVLYHSVHLTKLSYLPFTHEGCVVISEVSYLFAYFNSALNPFLYSFIGSGCRRKLQFPVG